MWHVGLLSLVYVASGPLSCWNVHWQESRSPSPMLRSFSQAWHGSGVNKVRKILSGRDLGRSLVTSRASSIDTVSRARHFKVRQFAIFAALFFMRASLCLSPRSCKHIVIQLVGNKHYPQEKNKTKQKQPKVAVHSRIKFWQYNVRTCATTLGHRLGNNRKLGAGGEGAHTNLGTASPSVTMNALQ